MLRLLLNHIEIATKGMTKTALFLSVCYPFISIPYPQSRKNVENNKSQVVYDDLKLNRNKVLWIKKIKSLLDQIGLGKLWVKADYMDVRYLQYYQAKIHLVIKNVFKFK